MYAEKLKIAAGMTHEFPAIKVSKVHFTVPCHTCRAERPFCCQGETKPIIRHKWLSQFKAGVISVLLLSQVGDVGIDLPSANVVIEVDAQGVNSFCPTAC